VLRIEGRKVWYSSPGGAASWTDREVCRKAHGANPVTRWMASNVAVAQDPAGNLKPAKDKSTSASTASSP
jgi:hypothetical protein